MVNHHNHSFGSAVSGSPKTPNVVVQPARRNSYKEGRVPEYVSGNSSFDFALPPPGQSSPMNLISPRQNDQRLRVLEEQLALLTKHCSELKEKGDHKGASTWFQAFRYILVAALVAVTIYVCYEMSVQWVESGSQPSVTYSLDEVDSLAMPTAGMIPAPYATDSRCFQPTPLKCNAYVDEQLAFDCMSWLSITATTQRVGGGTTDIWTLDGVKATQHGFYFKSILDYVEYTFEFPADCTEPYLWVYVSGDTKIVTEAQLDPTLSMRSYAQSSFLIQGGQYVMVAFSMFQDVDLNQYVTNTSTLSVSSMMVSAFNASLVKQATAVFRPGSFKIQTTTQQPGMSFIEFIASVGGWIGLFLGFSFLHIVEFAELVYEWLHKKKQVRPDDAPVVGKVLDDDETL